MLPDHIHKIDVPFLMLTREKLWIFKGYRWDGPSGPAIDTENAMRASLVHDALYQLIRLGHIPPETRKTADQLFLKILKEDGVSFPRRWRFYLAVRCFGGRHIKP